MRKIKPLIARPGATLEPHQRRHDLDLLRVLAFIILIGYHAGMPFVSWDWHLENDQHSVRLQSFMRFVNQWRLPLLFVISGAAVRFSLRRRGATSFLKDRLLRLGVPLAFGMLVIVPPQVYLEWRADGRIASGFASFYPSIFKGVYPDGALSWHHLWYVAYVLAFSLVCAPLLFWLERRRRGKGTCAETRSIRWPAALFVLAVPVAVCDIALRKHWPNTHNLVADWANVVQSLWLFLAGFVLVPNQRVRAATERILWVALGLGCVTFSVLYWGYWSRTETTAWFGYNLYWILRDINMTAWLLAIFGAASRWLDRPSHFLRVTTPAVYPVYILHQTVLVVLAYWILPTELSIGVKFAILVAGTFVISCCIYEVCIRRFAITRVLFGMKARSE